jgi:putative transposase
MLKGVYTAANEDAALASLAAFAESDLGKRYPGAVGVWERAGERFTPFWPSRLRCAASSTPPTPSNR